MNTILWTIEAKETYDNISDYLHLNWGFDTASKFMEKVSTLINNLKQHTYLCPPSHNKPDFRRCTVNKQISMVYQVVGNAIFIVEFYDNRSNNDYT